MKTKEKTCESRIDEELKSRIQEFETVLELSENSKDGSFNFEDCHYEDFTDWINSFALAYDKDPHYRAMRLELSYGGPQDYFLFFKDESIEYRFLDWFDGAKRELYGKDYAVMQRVKDYLTF